MRRATANATFRGMTRVRISTTIDESVLRTARSVHGGPDARMVEEALVALIAAERADAERAALALHPYETDPELTWSGDDGALLPFDGPVPAAVQRLAAARRKQHL